jgi:hypothetical protein
MQPDVTEAQGGASLPARRLLSAPVSGIILGLDGSPCGRMMPLSAPAPAAATIPGDRPLSCTEHN